MHGSMNMQVGIGSTNRAPYYSDATTDNQPQNNGHGLLAAAGTKTIMVVDKDGNQAFASSVLIVNSSGQNATVQINAVRGVAGKSGTGIHEPLLDEPKTPITVLAGESWGPIPVRTASVLETNTGAAIQTGQGVRYLFIVEAGK